MSSSRQSIFERIRRSSREEVILEEMIRLGFWPAAGTMPADPADEVRRKHELERELDALRSNLRSLNNEAALKKAMRKRLLEQSRQKRQETKERRERERAGRAADWAKRREETVLFLGQGVSGGLHSIEGNAARLAAAGLPVLGDAAAIAGAMGISVGQLRFLAYSRKVSESTNYVRFAVPKKSGGLRVISAPMPRLLAAQTWILRNVLDRVPLHPAAHGFRAGRSIVTNAQAHKGADVVVNLDLKDFFPSIDYRRVKGVFRALGYSEAAATVFGLVCTAPDVEEVELDGKRYFVATGPRRLPQGAPTSPALSNVLCRRLDRRLDGLASCLGFTYTRYADDLTFSASGGNLRNICNLLVRAEAIIAHEGLRVNVEKTRVVRRARQQEVTGLVVNDKVGVPRETLRRFRALLFQIEKDGPDGKHWGGGGDVLASIVGFANFVSMVDSEKGRPLRERALRIARQHGWRPPARPTGSSPSPVTKAPEPEPETGSNGKKWWKLW